MSGRPWTVAEASEWLTMSRWTLYERAAKGTIPHRKRGRALRFFEHELAAWLDGAELERIDLPSSDRVVRPVAGAHR